ncbi:MAG: hypothetical protein FJ087_01750 [Deltaproteobacteria bacterium]|nr:hypothetical protein [Deltaproteobacteria bacterium]
MTATRKPARLLPLILPLVAACASSGGGDSADMSVGDARSEVVARLGAPASARDLGPGGVLLSYPGRGMSLLVAGPSDDAPVTSIRHHAGSPFRAAGDPGVGIGADRDAVRAALGEASVDPFLGTWRYAAAGLAFEWEGDVVATIAVTARTR